MQIHITTRSSLISLQFGYTLSLTANVVSQERNASDGISETRPKSVTTPSAPGSALFRLEGRTHKLCLDLSLETGYVPINVAEDRVPHQEQQSARLVLLWKRDDLIYGSATETVCGPRNQAALLGEPTLVLPCFVIV